MCANDYKQHCWSGLKCLRCGKEAQTISQTSRQNRERQKANRTPTSVVTSAWKGGKSLKATSKQLTVKDCFKILGYTDFNMKPSKKNVSFWAKNYERLPYILQDCHKLYLGLCKTAHPDKKHVKASNETMSSLNAAWRRLQRLFAARKITL